MRFEEIIQYFITIGVILGGIDYLLKNKFGLGSEFEKGVYVIGPLFLHMAGVIFWAPVLGNVLAPWLTPFWGFFGIDPSVTASVFAIDMGGYHMARTLAESPEAGIYTGIILSSMLGATLVFSIPIGLNIIPNIDISSFTRGITAGLITLPIGAFIGGVVAGFPLQELILNTMPVLILSFILAIFSWYRPQKVAGLVTRLAVLIRWLAVSGLVIKATEQFSKISIVPGMASFSLTFELIGTISLFLIGAFPLARLVSIIFKKPLAMTGSFFKINGVAITGMITSVVNNIPMFNLYAEMDRRGKVINAAFMVSGAFVLGGQLAVTYHLEPLYILPFIVAKFSAGILSIPLALWISNKAENTYTGPTQSPVETD